MSRPQQNRDNIYGEQPNGYYDPRTQSPVLSPNGTPFPRRFDDYPIPYVTTFSGLTNTAWRMLMHNRQNWAMTNFGRDFAINMRHDEQLMTFHNERRRWVKKRPWHIAVPNDKDPREKYLKDGLETVIKMTPFLRDMMFCLLDGNWFGRQGIQTRMAWDEIAIPKPKGGKVVQSMSPKAPVNNGTSEKVKVLRVLGRGSDDPGWMQWQGDKIGHSYDNTPYVLVNGASQDQLPPGLPQWWSTLGKAVPLVDWERERCIIYRFSEGMMDPDFFQPDQADARNGIGLRDMSCFLQWMKMEWLSNVSDWVESIGMGIRIWRYKSGNAESKKRADTAAKANMHRYNLLVPVEQDDRGGPDTQGLELIEPTGSGVSVVRDLIDYVDRTHERFYLGQSQSGGMGRGGGKSGGHSGGLGGAGFEEMAEETKSDIETSDAYTLGEVMTHDFVRVLVKYGFPDYADIPARWEWGEDKQDPKPRLEAMAIAHGMGATLIESEVVEAAGCTVPTTGDKVLSVSISADEDHERSVDLMGTKADAMPKKPPGKADDK
jgi:phage gp29-like protein